MNAFLLSVSVILYSCSLMGTNCGQCLAQESRYDCSYCIEGPPPPVAMGNCQFEATCSTGNGFLRFNDPLDVVNCPRPIITDVNILCIIIMMYNALEYRIHTAQS